MHVQFVVVTGCLGNGFTFEGPFVEHDDAVDYAEAAYGTKENWWINDVILPVNSEGEPWSSNKSGDAA